MLHQTVAKTPQITSVTYDRGLLYVLNAGGDSAYSNTISAITPPGGGGGQAVVDCITYDTSGGPMGDKHLHVTVVVVDDMGFPIGGANVSITVSLEGLPYASPAGTTIRTRKVSALELERSCRRLSTFWACALNATSRVIKQRASILRI